MDDLKTMLATPSKLTYLLPLLMLGQASVCLAELDISGVDSDIAKVISNQSPLQDAPCDAPAWWLDKQLDKTQRLAAEILETQGYYQASFVHKLNTDASCWAAALDITLGEPTRINQVNISGLSELNLTADTLAEWLPKTGQTFVHADYENAKSQLIDVARSQGYLDARWQENRVTVDLTSSKDGASSEATSSANIELALDIGPPYLLGEVEHNTSDIDAHFLAKFYDLAPGTRISRATLDKAYQNLMATGYLSALSITPRYDATQDFHVPVTIEGVAARKRTYEIGAGYATDSGARARGEVQWRRINARGDKARLSALAAQSESTFSMEYRRADEDDPRNRWISFAASYEFDEPDTYKREKTALTATQSQRREDQWVLSNVVQYSSEVWRIADTDGDTQLVSLGQGWQTSHSQGKRRLAKGRSINVSWRGVAKALGSDINVLQLQAAYKTIRPIKNAWRLLSRAHMGINVADNLDQLPPDLRFFAGGDHSIRGYDLDTVGEIRNVEGTPVVIGGKRIIDGSLELDRAISKDWSAALFVDAGSAFNHRPDIVVGAGVGARWYSPLGPIRIDIAHGFDGLSPGWRLHVSFGAEL